MSVVLFLIGSSVGPAIAGIYMQTHQELAKGVTIGSFPSAISYSLIFLTAALISAISITLVIILRRRITQSQSTLKLEMEASNMKQDARRDEVGKND
jgi:type II secretory pathway component PulF